MRVVSLAHKRLLETVGKAGGEDQKPLNYHRIGRITNLTIGCSRLHSRAIGTRTAENPEVSQRRLLYESAPSERDIGVHIF